jgi:hypothetical protein
VKVFEALGSTFISVRKISLPRVEWLLEFKGHLEFDCVILGFAEAL